MPAGAAGLRFSGFLGWWVDGRSGWLWDRGDVGEDRDDRGGPGPGFGDPQTSLACTVDQACGDVQEPVAQRLRLTSGQGGGIAVTAEQSRPGSQVRGDLGERQPGLVDRELPRGEPAQTAVFGLPDAVLHPGVSAVPGLEERQLSDGVLVTKAW